MSEQHDDDDAFARAWDQREMSEIGRQHGPSLARAVGRLETARVSGILARDREYRLTEMRRTQAELELRDGVFVNLSDTASAPTPEQFAQAQRTGARFRKFTPTGTAGTARTITAYRRQDLPAAFKLMMSSVISREGYSDCVWYRNLHETTGLCGNMASVDYGREVFTNPSSRAMFTEQQVEQQSIFRAVREGVDRKLLRLLDYVVLEDVPIYRAGRVVGAGWRKARSKFAEAVDQLHDAKHELERDS